MRSPGPEGGRSHGRRKGRSGTRETGNDNQAANGEAISWIVWQFCRQSLVVVQSLILAARLGILISTHNAICALLVLRFV